MKLTRRVFLTAGAVLASGSRGLAQAYPTRPVRVVVPFAPGGPTDIFARLIVQKLSDQLGKQFYIENVGGASGSIGTAQVAKAAPDGHTILLNVSSFAINPVFFAKVPVRSHPRVRADHARGDERRGDRRASVGAPRERWPNSSRR